MLNNYVQADTWLSSVCLRVCICVYVCIKGAYSRIKLMIANNWMWPRIPKPSCLSTEIKICNHIKYVDNILSLINFAIQLARVHVHTVASLGTAFYLLFLFLSPSFSLPLALALCPCKWLFLIVCVFVCLYVFVFLRTKILYFSSSTQHSSS